MGNGLGPVVGPLEYVSSALVTTTDTTEKSIETITLHAGVVRIISFWCMGHGGAGETTLENVSGIFKIQSVDLPALKVTIPIECLTITGTGVGIITPRLWPLNRQVSGQWKIEGLITMDITLAINPVARWGMVLELAA